MYLLSPFCWLVHCVHCGVVFKILTDAVMIDVVGSFIISFPIFYYTGELEPARFLAIYCVTAFTILVFGVAVKVFCQDERKRK